ncbi:hypothetical protein H1C71_021380, partial [Ictidomys tridecemlineatus]
ECQVNLVGPISELHLPLLMAPLRPFSTFRRGWSGPVAGHPLGGQLTGGGTDAQEPGESFLQSLRGLDGYLACCPETLSVLIKQKHQHINLRLQVFQDGVRKQFLESCGKAAAALPSMASP